MTAATKPRTRSIRLTDDEVRLSLSSRAVVLYLPIKPQPEMVGPNGGTFREIVPSLLLNCGGLFDVRYDGDNPKAIRCPHGVRGDRLAAKEAWCLAIPAGASIHAERVPHYRADGVPMPRWYPSSWMPRQYSRIMFEIIYIHVEIVGECLWALTLKRLDGGQS